MLVLHCAQVLIYNAGVLHETMQTKLAEVTAQMLTDTLATNTVGPLLVTQALAKQVGFTAAVQCFKQSSTGEETMLSV